MLDDINAMKQADKNQILSAIGMLADQCKQAFEETEAINLPSDYTDIRNVVVSGMGGSHLGAQLIGSVYRKELKVPLVVQNHYTCPGFVDEHTLVLSTSFSGNTEEVLSFTKETAERKSKIIAISSGGALSEMARANNWPFYSFESTHNPSRIPRYGSGYLFLSQLQFLSKLGIVEFGRLELDQILTVIEAATQTYKEDMETVFNPAKQLATDLASKVVVLVASGHLAGSAYIFKNQLNESAKQMAALFEIPELNHHLLEGLAHPLSNKQHLQFVFFESLLYHSSNIKRFAITKEIVAQQGIGVSSYEPKSDTLLKQAFETLVFTGYTALYLAFINQVDPAPNPWVDLLKSKLAASAG